MDLLLHIALALAFLCYHCFPVIAWSNPYTSSSLLGRIRQFEGLEANPVLDPRRTVTGGRPSLKGGTSPLNMQNTAEFKAYPRSNSVLDKVQFPADLKNLSIQELKQLVDEVRWDVIQSVSQTGGHLSASLGVVELTVALHHVFNTPDDRLVWDVSHQAYAHKVITGRRAKMINIRQKNGLSGFCKRSESEYDPFGAGHSSTSISAVQGMVVGQSIVSDKPRNCIAVIGDGAVTGGMALEGLNYVGDLQSKMLVILNDNGQVSLPTGCNSAAGTGPAGALSSYTAKLLSSKKFLNMRDAAKRVTSLFPDYIRETAAKLDEFSRGMLTGGTLFEELGLYYVGPIDGHDLETLVSVLKNLKESDRKKPILLHIKTSKGYGYSPAMEASDKMHGVVKFDIPTGKQHKGSGQGAAFTDIFADTLCDIGKDDKSVVAITAAMPGGTGVHKFGKCFASRTFDVGIAEQHAVTFAAGMATEGVKPFCAIYSTFLQRAYDQIVHDVVLQKLPVRFILDRAGLVGPDGATHHGSFDLAYLGALPDIVLMAPSDEVELKNMIETAYEINNMPSFVRFPKATGYGVAYLNENFGYNLKEIPVRGTALEIGKGRIIRSASENAASKVAFLSLGTRLADAVEAAKSLETESDIGVTVADARFMRPLDIDLIRSLAKNHDALITIEEGSIGGFGSHVLQFLALDGILDEAKLKVRPLVLPDRFIEQATQEEQYEEAGLTARHIANAAKRILKRDFVHV